MSRSGAQGAVVRQVVLAGALLAGACAATTTETTTTIPSSSRRPLGSRQVLPGTTATLNLRYAPTSAAQTLDLYRPKKGRSPYPLVLRLNGSTEEPSAAAITDAGYALAIVRHRAGPDAPLGSGARDVKAAVRFLRANAAAYELDDTQFIAWGAGDEGWFAVMLGVTGDQATAFDDPSLGHATTSSAVQIVIDWGGPTDFGSLDVDQAEHSSPACAQTYERHSLPGTRDAQWLCGDRTTALTDPSCARAVSDAKLERYVPTAKALPAFYFAHGADDCIVSIWQSVRVLEALKKRDAEPGFHRMSRAGRDDPRYEAEETSRSLAFIQAVRSPDAGQR